MNIVFGSDSFLPLLHGVTTHIVLYAKALAQDGHNVLIVAPQYPKQQKLFLDEKISIIHLKSYSAGKLFLMKHSDDRLVNPFVKKRLFKMLDEFAPDIIHCHTEFAIGRLLLSYSKRNTVPIAMTSHTYFEYYIPFYFPWVPKRLCQWYTVRFIEFKFFKHAQLLIAPTELMKKNLNRYGITQEVKIIPTGIIESDFSIDDLNSLNIFKEQNPFFQKDVLLFVGRIVLEKNVLFLLDSFYRISEEFPELQLVYVGRGIGIHKVLERVKKYGIQDRVHILDPVPREKLRYYYHSCKIFTFPSLSETQGIVVLEAMICRKPVVGINSMGVGEIMRHSHSGGLISEPGDFEGYVHNIRRLLLDEDLYEQKSQEAYEIGKNWSIQPMYKRLTSAYEELLLDVHTNTEIKNNKSLNIGH